MNSTAYTAMLQQMEAGAYTEVSAKNTISNLYARQMLTENEYNTLMDKADNLAANTADGETLARVVALETSVKILTEEVDALKAAVEQAGGTVTEPTTGQTGAEDDPIDAVAGMSYEKDKYYRDPTNKEVYICTVDVAYAGLPHEAVNVYFNWVRKE
ncbi:hypothetical protein [Subdoligranulum variabile]|uniref:Uncharacterized protein n=1 Tax=Subdoligranulum variabile DSM 15176 TaxID=411471 RepID=D1PNE5_9FIRM|nr:hypothetical protein [Subdoligranulum variabile]EFB76080.1 hypothetical protein SUBVAR_05866 [Subdoligranulum variabile DSM 15176]UWP68729.1 hypothetical protein NQ490_02450 [Subdoligranulum variabile]